MQRATVSACIFWCSTRLSIFGLRGHQSVTFSRILWSSGVRPRREFIMIGLVRAVMLCATLALGLTSVQAADKAFKRDDLADSAIKLEAQIKSEAGPFAKSSPSLPTVGGVA